MKEVMVISCPCGGTLEITYEIKHNDPGHNQTRLDI